MKKLSIFCFVIALILTAVIVVNAVELERVFAPLILSNGEVESEGNPYPAPYPLPQSEPTKAKKGEPPVIITRHPRITDEPEPPTPTPHTIDPPTPPPPPRPTATDEPPVGSDWWCDEHPDDPRCKKVPPTPFPGGTP